MGIGVFSLMATLAIGHLIFAVITYRAIQRLVSLTFATNRRVMALDSAFKTLEELYKLEASLVEKRKRLESPSVELREFLCDFLEEGCGILRIQPSSILIRGLKG